MSDHVDYDTVTHENFVLSGRLSAPEVYVDGLSQMVMFGAIAKLVLHSVAFPQTSDNPEIRKAVQTLSMPVLHAVELANFILKAAKDSEDRLMRELGEEQAQKVKSMLSQISTELPKDLQRTAASPKKKK